jgi:hypothetical protein
MKQTHRSNKNHNLFIRGSKIWFKFVFRGKQVVTSTGLSPSGTSAWREARQLRDHWIAGIRREGLAYVDRQKPKKEAKTATFEDIFTVYDFVTDINRNTIRDNKAVIRKILKFSKLTPKAPIEVLNRIIAHYRDHQSTRPNSINAEIRAAKSVFCPRCIELYQSNGIELPNLTPFRNLSLLRGNKPEGLPPLEIMQQLDSREIELGGDLLKAWILVRYAGMRNREIYELKTEALQTNGERFWIDPDHTKTGESRQIPIREEHMQFLLHGANGTVLEGHKTRRKNLVNRELSFWLRQFIPPEYNKTVYAVRKYCESLMVEAYGSFKASKILGHSSEISYTYYARVLTLPEPI